MITLKHILKWIEHSFDCIQAERMLADVLPVIEQPAALANPPAQAWLSHRDCPLSNAICGRSYGKLIGRIDRKPANTHGFASDFRLTA